MPPMVKVEITHDGMDVYAAALQPNLKIRYGLFNGKIKQVGAIAFEYGFNGGIRKIGNSLRVEYDWNGNIKKITGRDDRIEVVVYARSQSSENRDARKSSRS